MRAPILAIALLAAAPAFGFDSGYKTWDGNECLIVKTGEIVPCDKYMLEAIDRDKPASRSLASQGGRAPQRAQCAKGRVMTVCGCQPPGKPLTWGDCV